MQKWLLVAFLFCSQMLWAQRGLVYVKKHGIKKVKTFTEGSTIQFKTKDKQQVQGIIALVRSDSLYINGYWYRAGSISRIVLRNKSGIAEPLLLTTAGVVLSTTAMTIAKWTSFQSALSTSAGIGYSNFLIRNAGKFMKRKKYKIGKKFTVQTLDLHF